MLGSAVTSLAGQIVTGECAGYRSSLFNMFPTAELAGQGASIGISAIQGDFVKGQKAATKLLEAGFMTAGVPTTALKEYGRALGIGDGDGELSFKPLALTGRRD